MMNRILLFSVATIVLLAVVGLLMQGKFSQNNKEEVNLPAPVQKQISGQDVEIVTENLEIPWEVAFLSSGEMLVTERPGRLLKIDQDKKVIEIENVAHVGEGGLLGLVIHPDFSQNKWIYLYLTTRSGGRLVNQVERYRLEGATLTDKKVILNGIAGASNHDGGRIAFGPDGFLYITTGDAQQENLAQNINLLNGKILRVNDDGGIPEDNPFGNAVYSYGHRNAQGLAWDSQGRLWATEHGRSGIRSGLDEINLIEKGKNYGWPIVQGSQTKEGIVTPVLHSGENTTWAPSGAAFWEGSIFFGGLRGEALYEAKINPDNTVSLKTHLQNQFGRIRAVSLGPDGFLYITTSNRDGRGDIKEGDDKLIKINPQIFR